MTLPNTLNNSMLQGAQRTLLPQTFLQKSGSREIQTSTAWTTTAPDQWSYTPGAGQTVYLIGLRVLVWDNTQWASQSNFGDAANNLTDGIDIKVGYAGAVDYSIINASNLVYWDRNSYLYYRSTNRANTAFLSASFTADDRALLGYFDFSRQNIILKGDSSEKIYLGIRQSLAGSAIELLWATVGGWLL